MGVDHAQVEGSEVRVGVSQGNEHGAVDSWITFVDLTGWLIGETSVFTSDLKRSVGQVQLRDPSDKSRGAGSGVGDVGVVGTDGETGVLPGEVDQLSREGQRLRAVARDGWAARVAGVLGAVDVHTALVSRDSRVGGVSDAAASNLVRLGVVGREAVGVGLVVDEQSREVLPCKTSGVLGAGADVGSKVGPLPGLRDTSLEPDGHRRKTHHLTERDLLAGLGSDGQGEKVGNLARVHVGKETPYTRLTEASDLDVEVDELADRAIWVVVSALGGSSLAEHVGEESSVTSFLGGHKSNVGAVLSSQTSVKEVLGREDGKTVVEQIELNPLLVETKGDGLVVEVAVDHVARLSTVGAKTTSRHVGNGHGVLRQTVGVVVGSRWVWGQRSNGGAHSSRPFSSSSSGGSTRVRSMAGGTSYIRTPSGRSRASCGRNSL